MVHARSLGAVCTSILLAAACSSNESPGSSGGDAGNAETAGRGGASAGAGSSGTGGRNAGGAGASGGSAGTASDGGRPDAASDPGTPIAFTVDVAKDVHPISSYIYCQSVGGMAAGEVAKLAETAGLRLVRAGGNRFSAYNWENNASNAGSDYRFQNDGYLSSSDVPGDAIKGVLTTANDGKVATVLTAQLGDYVAADKNGDGDVAATADYLATRFKKNVFTKAGALANPPDATDSFVYQDEFLGWVKASYPQGTFLVALDNEPDIWGSTHKEIWPTAPSYDEVIKRNIDYARMARRQYPSAELLGLASYGWNGWRTFQGAYTAGDYLDYYLDQVKAAEGDAGGRLIDYVDVHWYPEALGVAGDKNTRITNGGTSEAEITARVQAPRSLWESAYVETSWITDNLKRSEAETKGAINLIPRLKKQIAMHYPDTKLAFAEWNYGADAHISGGVATADVLGIFGRESVDLACNWHANSASIFRDGAYQIFGNYDGKGSKFGDTSVSANAASARLASIYAATDKSDPTRLTLIVVNKDTQAHMANIDITSDRKYKSAQVFLLSAAAEDGFNKTAHPQAAPDVTTTTPNQLAVPMPPMSVAMVVPSTEATAPTGPAWPKPAVVTESGWTFDADTEGFELNAVTPSTMEATLAWNATEGKPKAGSLKIEIPFGDRKQLGQIVLGGQSLDLTGKKLQVNVRRNGAFDGGIMLFAGSAADKSWVAHGWTMLGSEEWTTIVLDPVAAKESNPDFDPSAVTYLGVQFNTGDGGSTTPSPVTFYVDQIVTVSAAP